MPYIKQADRDRLKKSFPLTEGELNYTITLVCQNYLRDYGVSYKNINAVVGALECAKLELYRRVVSPYEDRKISENGDVLVCKQST